MRCANCFTWSLEAFCIARLPSSTSACPPVAACYAKAASLEANLFEAPPFWSAELLFWSEVAAAFWLSLSPFGLARFCEHPASARPASNSAAKSMFFIDSSPSRRWDEERSVRDVSAGCVKPRCAKHLFFLEPDVSEVERSLHPAFIHALDRELQDRAGLVDRDIQRRTQDKDGAVGGPEQRQQVFEFVGIGKAQLFGIQLEGFRHRVADQLARQMLGGQRLLLAD